ncbi:PQQ-binding-like beta-propeller repeat protein [Methanococcoides sp. SA1]|nr:PQQ-binding-like beta-propeller repeat protein [Methanococcoides sp. SA1]
MNLLKKTNITKLFVGILLVMLLIPAASASDWDQFQKDNYNNGLTSDKAPITSPIGNGISWEQSFSFAGWSGIDEAPIVLGDTVYVVGGDNKVRAMDKTTGTVKWETATSGGGFLLGNMGAGNGMVFVPTSDGKIFAINADSGIVEWSATESGQMNTPVIYDDHKIYFGSCLGKNAYYCYSDTGTEIWERVSTSGSGYYWAGAALIDEYLVYGDDAGHLTSVYKVNGTTIQEMDVSAEFGVTVNEIRSSICYVEDLDRIYFTSKGNYIYALGMNNDGTFDTTDKHHANIGYSTVTPAVYNGKVYVGAGGMYGGGAGISCLDADLTDEDWHFAAEAGGVQSSPAITTAYDDGDGEIYIYFTTNTAAGKIYCVNESGVEQWSWGESGKTDYTLCGVAISDGWILYGTDNKYVFGFATTGSLAVPQPPETPVLACTEVDRCVCLSWNTPASDEEITSFKVYRATSSGAETLYETVSADATVFADHDVTNDQTYYYQVSAVSNLGEGDLSTEISGTPVAEVVSDSWEHFMGDLQHTGYSATAGPKTNATLWETADIDAEDGASMVIADDLGLMFVISDAKDSPWTPTVGYNNLSAINLNDGSVAWDVTFGDLELSNYNSYDSWATPAYNNGVVFTAGDGARYANNGTLKWGPLPMNTNGGPLAVEGKVIVGNWDGKQYFCFDEETGTELWNISVNGNAQGTPAYNNGHLFLTSYNEVNCVDMDGNVVWIQAIDNVYSSATVQYGLIYIALYDMSYGTQYVYALEEDTGNVVWQATMADQMMTGTDGTPAVAYGYVYVTAGMAMIDQNTYCFDAFTGETVWVSSEAGSWFTSPVVSDGVVYTGAEEYFTGSGGMGSFTRTVALDAFDGSLVWESDVGGSTPALYNGILYTVGFQKVYAFSDMKAPTADFTADTTSGTEPLAVQFTDMSTDAESWSWDFDNDGVKDSIEQNPQFDYTNAGTYTVSLTVSNTAGSNTETKVDYIVVNDWNPWNDIGSEGAPNGTYITITEVIDAYNCFKNGTSAPGTDAAIDISIVIDIYNAFTDGTAM